MTIVKPEKFEFTWAWFVELLERVLADIFGFIAKEEGWDA